MSKNSKSKWFNLIDWYEERGLTYPLMKRLKKKSEEIEFCQVRLHIVCENFFENMDTLESLLSKMNLDPGKAFNIYDTVEACIQNISKEESHEKIILWWMSTKDSEQVDFFKNKINFSFAINMDQEISLEKNLRFRMICSYHPQDWQKFPAYKKDVWSQALKIKEWI